MGPGLDQFLPLQWKLAVESLGLALLLAPLLLHPVLSFLAGLALPPSP